MRCRKCGLLSGVVIPHGRPWYAASLPSRMAGGAFHEPTVAQVLARQGRQLHRRHGLNPYEKIATSTTHRHHSHGDTRQQKAQRADTRSISQHNKHNTAAHIHQGASNCPLMCSVTSWLESQRALQFFPLSACAHRAGPSLSLSGGAQARWQLARKHDRIHAATVGLGARVKSAARMPTVGL